MAMGPKDLVVSLKAEELWETVIRIESDATKSDKKFGELVARFNLVTPDEHNVLFAAVCSAIDLNINYMHPKVMDAVVVDCHWEKQYAKVRAYNKQ